MPFFQYTHPLAHTCTHLSLAMPFLRKFFFFSPVPDVALSPEGLGCEPAGSQEGKKKRRVGSRL
jgi:hypothetical protein